MFLLRAGLGLLSSSASHVAEITSTYYHPNLFVEMGTFKLFAWVGLES
jgi:hypothetical protein